MIKIDISRAIPPRLGTYLIGIIPGVFFEASIAAGDPQFAASVIYRVREIYPFGPYALLVLFTASGLLIGQGFFLAAWIVDLLITSAFVLWGYAIRMTFGSQWFYRYFAKLQGIPPKQKGFIRLLSRVMMWARGRNYSSASKPVLKCLYIATQRLLRVRYGIDRKCGPWDEGEWGAWYSVLGKPLKDFREATLASRAFLGCGLAGFTALHASPPLRVGYFIGLCLIFTFAGCLTSVDLARWKFNPVKKSITRLRAVLLELSEVGTTTEKLNSDSGKGPGALIDTNEGD